MAIFSALIIQIIPLLLLIGVGYVAGRCLDVQMHSLSMLSIYLLVPFVIAISLANIDLKLEYVAIPFVLYVICSTLCVVAVKLGKLTLDKSYHPLMALLGGLSNTGYFGIPIITALLGPAAIGIYMLFNMGLAVTEVTTAYYLANRANLSIKDSIKRVLRLPPLYGVGAGITLNLLNIEIPDIVHKYWQHATGAYIIIGMMLIGVGLSKLNGLKLNWRFTSLCFAHKYLIWPLTFLGLILLDKTLLHALDHNTHIMLLLIGICPLPANAVAYATQLKLPAEEVAATILLSTIFALLYVPAVISLYYFLIPT